MVTGKYTSFARLNPMSKRGKEPEDQALAVGSLKFSARGNYVNQMLIKDSLLTNLRQ
jgi:hypothetical protein